MTDGSQPQQTLGKNRPAPPATAEDGEQLDRRFNPWRRAGTGAARLVVIEALRFVANYEAHFKLRKRARRGVDQRTFEETVQALLCDAIHRQLTEAEHWFRLPLSNRVLRCCPRNSPSPFQRKAAPRDHLRHAGSQLVLRGDREVQVTSET